MQWRILKAQEGNLSLIHKDPIFWTRNISLALLSVLVFGIDYLGLQSQIIAWLSLLGLIPLFTDTLKTYEHKIEICQFKQSFLSSRKNNFFTQTRQISLDHILGLELQPSFNSEKYEQNLIIYTESNDSLSLKFSGLSESDDKIISLIIHELNFIEKPQDHSELLPEFFG